MLEPNIELYGSHARPSALADFLELQAWKHTKSMSKAELQDYIVDADWARLSEEKYFAPSEDPNDLEDPSAETMAELTFAALDERSQHLGLRYPFEVAGSRVNFVKARRKRGTRYLHLLALTLAHGFRVPTGALARAPQDVFEDTVARTLDQLGLTVAVVPARAGASGTFDTTIKDAAAKVDLIARPQDAYRSKFAKDGGVDVLSHLWWGDQRQGRWVFAGQVTVGNSDSWRVKALDVSPNTWRLLLGLVHDPLPFLAVPHHVAGNVFGSILQDTRALVIDRLRLAAWDIQHSPDEVALTTLVAAQAVMSPF